MEEPVHLQIHAVVFVVGLGTLVVKVCAVCVQCRQQCRHMHNNCNPVNPSTRKPTPKNSTLKSTRSVTNVGTQPIKDALY